MTTALSSSALSSLPKGSVSVVPRHGGVLPKRASSLGISIFDQPLKDPVLRQALSLKKSHRMALPPLRGAQHAVKA